MQGFDFTETVFSASHRGDFAEELHGHTFYVRVYWPAEPCRDAREVHAALVRVLDAFDHSTLDGKVEPTNYGVCKAIASRLTGLSKVEVWRDGRVPCGAQLIINLEKGAVSAPGRPGKTDQGSPV